MEYPETVHRHRTLWRYEFAPVRPADDVLDPQADIIGSNASRQTIREISYRLVAALAPLVTAYSWNARPL